MVVRAPDLDRGEDREDRLAAVLEKGRLVALAAGEVGPPVPPTVGVEEVLQESAAHLVQRAPQGQFGGLQVQGPAAFALPQDPRDYVVEFRGDFLANRRCNFFFNCVSARASATSWTGRSSQSCSLVSTSSPQSRTKVR